MKMVSAAKLRRAQDRVIAARPYADAAARRCWPIVAAAAATDERSGVQSAAGRSAPEKRIQLVLITSDKGLAGAFNSNLIKAAQKFAAGAPGRRDRI